MKKTIVIIAAALAVLAGVVWASDRLRVIAVDGDSSPVYTTAKSVSLTPPVTATQTVAGLTQIISNQVKAATTQVALTPTVLVLSNLTRSITFASSWDTTNLYTTVAVVTNVVVVGAPATYVVNTAWGFATTTAGVATNVLVGEVVTNATIGTTDGGIGFSGAQAGAILTNANLFYRMLQSY